MKGLSQLFYLYGIGYEFTKYTGEHVVFDEATRCQALIASGFSDFSSESISKRNYELDVKKWTEVVEPITLVNEQGKAVIYAHERYLNSYCLVSIPELAYSKECKLLHDQVVGEYYQDEQRYVAINIDIVDIAVTDIGYFDCVISGQFGQFGTELWVVPERCYGNWQSQGKFTGFSIQLYTLRPKKSQGGFGTFAELRQLITELAAIGADYILLNPLHLLFESEPERASPYSPNDRKLINPLYIDLLEVGSFVGAECSSQFFSELSKSELDSDFTHTEFDIEFIDMTLLSEWKYDKLRTLWKLFEETKNVDALSAFHSFQNKQAHLLKPISKDAFAVFLQWLAFGQFEACQNLSKQLGMKVGLIRDLAVGCAPDSIEYDANEHLFAKGADVGAPPDPWAEHGQNWGLPAINPATLLDNKLNYFKALFKSNMHACGGLRIDHVMALRRLWWCMNNGEMPIGCYVYYPFEHLVAALKIESHLNQCGVIGEDLGVVPPEVNKVMDETDIYSNILFYFEKDHNGQFMDINEHKEKSLLMIANHDVPPFKSWWEECDIQLKRKYDLLNESEVVSAGRDRAIEKQKLLHWFERYSPHQYDLNSSSHAVYWHLLNTLSKSRSHMLTIQLDDLDEQAAPVNIPGTDKEYPNWRRRLSKTTSSIISSNKKELMELIKVRKGA